VKEIGLEYYYDFVFFFLTSIVILILFKKKLLLTILEEREEPSKKYEWNKTYKVCASKLVVISGYIMYSRRYFPDQSFAW